MRTVIALVIALLLVTPVFAQDILFNACTKDGKTAVLKLDIQDEAVKDAAILATISAAFKNAANTLTADELVDGPGFQVFVSKLDQAAWNAIEHFYGAPVVDSNFTCKVSNGR